MTAVGGVRAPSFITRSWIVTPAGVNYHLPIRRSLHPYRIRPRKFHSTSRASSSSAIPHISLHIAASSSGKGRKFRPDDSTYDFDPDAQRAIGMQTGKDIYQRRRNRPDSGEDAYFVAKIGQNTNATAFGILDGVGGWNTHGINPADFSHGMAHYMASTAVGWSDAKHGPRTLLEMGYQKVLADPSIPAGGSTACVAVAGQDGRMRIANLGDSGFVQVRLGAVQHYSNPQTHAFNTPYQLSVTPPHMLAQAAVFGGAPLNDAPDQADLADHMLGHGDVLVLATDGVWDNLNTSDVLSIVSNQMRMRGAWTRADERGYVVSNKITELTRAGQMRDQSPVPTLQAAIAAAIVGEAKLASMNDRRDGPFAKEVQKYYPGESYHGGKVDDISALVVISVDSNRSDEQIKAKL